MRTRVRPVLLLPLLLAVALGCSNKLTNRGAEVSGTVTYKGQPVTGGSMTFFFGDVSYPVAIQADGKYSANQLPEGEAVVTVDTEALNPKKAQYPGAGGQKDRAGGGMSSPIPEGSKGGAAGTYVKVPDKYRTKATSDLKITLARGKQEKPIELKD